MRPAATSLELLVFEVAGQHYALPVHQVREVLPRAALTALPEGPATMAGILRLRGALLPVVDLRHRLGLPPVAPQLSHCIVVVLVGKFAVGMLVDAVHGLISADRPDATGAPSRADRIIERVVETAGGVVTVLAAEALVGADLGAIIAIMGAPNGSDDAPKPAALPVGRAEGGQ